MNIVFCADDRVLPGLHVAAYSILKFMSPEIKSVSFYLLTETISKEQIQCLETTLLSLRRDFSIVRQAVDESRYRNFPPINGSWATYYRLLAPEVLDLEHFLYVDVDTLCTLDLSPLTSFAIDEFPVAWVPEAPMAKAADQAVATYLGGKPGDSYFNAGVMFINVENWRREQVTASAMEFLKNRKPDFWDQSALNVALYQKSKKLPPEYNCITNMRSNWPSLKAEMPKMDRLLHFLDYPKPWDFMGEFCHPFYHLWKSELNNTELKHYRSWQSGPSRRVPKTRNALKGYKKALKDRFLFTAYRNDLLKRIKGLKPVETPN